VLIARDRELPNAKSSRRDGSDDYTAGFSIAARDARTAHRLRLRIARRRAAAHLPLTALPSRAIISLHGGKSQTGEYAPLEVCRTMLGERRRIEGLPIDRANQFRRRHAAQKLCY